MASPQTEVFALFNLTTNAVLTGQAGLMSFLTYKDTTGTNLVAPAITEIGGGFYSFTPTMPVSADRGLVYVIDTGANANPSRVSRYVRHQDYDPEWIRQFLGAKWHIETSGPDANRLVVYAADGVSTLIKFALQTDAGAPTTLNPLRRIPL